MHTDDRVRQNVFVEISADTWEDLQSIHGFDDGPDHAKEALIEV